VLKHFTESSQVTKLCASNLDPVNFFCADGIVAMLPALRLVIRDESIGTISRSWF